VPACPLAVGFTLEKLSAHTIDEAGKEVFVHKNALELLRKVRCCVGRLQLHAARTSVQWWHESACISSQGTVTCCMQASELKRLSVYYDVHTELWKPDKPWADMKPDDWTALFQPGIAAVSEDEPQPSHTYVLKPVDGRLQYIRRGRNVRKDESQAIQEADLKLHAISLHISSAYPCANAT
jgi:vacuolar protein sorting-associated protein 13A/C